MELTYLVIAGMSRLCASVWPDSVMAHLVKASWNLMLLTHLAGSVCVCVCLCLCLCASNKANTILW